MKNKKLETALVVFGIFGSLAAGLALFVVGAVANSFTLSIVGVVVLVVGIVVTSIGAMIPYIIEAARNYKNEDPLSAREAAALDKAMQRMMKTPKQPIKDPRKDVSALMDREDALLDELELPGNESLLNEYKAQADAIWDKYTGDDWDENLEQISELVDYYSRLINN